jgi:hypothetical protein
MSICDGCSLVTCISQAQRRTKGRCSAQRDGILQLDAADAYVRDEVFDASTDALRASHSRGQIAVGSTDISERRRHRPL